ncbi:MAG: response regulator [Prevotella sp.]|nr:response regulator [Prevotella sp.]MBR2035934.1 response regulator [Prevotella sp.]
MYDYHIAIIDDNKAVLQSLKLVLEGVFRSVTIMTLPNALPAILAAGKVDAVLLDMNFSAQKLDGQEGLTWLRYIKQQENPPAVVMITAFGDINIAVNSLKEGAEDFITKPWDNDELVEKLLAAIDRCRQQKNLNRKASEADVLIEKQETLKQMTLDEVEKQHILEMMQECGNNLSDVARRLNIGRQKLYSKLKKYGLMV